MTMALLESPRICSGYDFASGLQADMNWLNPSCMVVQVVQPLPRIASKYATRSGLKCRMKALTLCRDLAVK